MTVTCIIITTYIIVIRDFLFPINVTIEKRKHKSGGAHDVEVVALFTNRKTGSVKILPGRILSQP